MKNRLYVKQDDYKDCGVSCLLSIIRYYNGDVSKEYLRDLTKTNKDGVNALNLVEAMEQIGFESYGINSELNSLQDLVPMIGHVIMDKKYQHFVAIYKIDKKRQIITVMDPSYGIKKISFKEWDNVTTKNYLIFKPKQIIPKLVNEKSFSSILFPFLKNNRFILIQIIIFSIIYMLISIITSYSFKLLLEEVNVEQLLNIKKVFIILILFNFCKCFIYLFRNKLINYIDHKLDKIIFDDIYSHVINLPYLYYKNRTTGDVITRINDSTNIREFISNFFVSVIVDLLLMIGVSVFLIQISPKLFIVTIGILIGYIIIITIFNNCIYQSVRSNYQNSSLVNSYLYETISGIDTIKGLCLRESIILKTKNKYHKLNKSNFKLTNYIHKEEFYKSLLYTIGNLVIIYLGVINIKDGNLSIMSLVVFINLLTYFFEPINQLPMLSLSYKNAKESLKRLLELYQLSSENLIKSNKNDDTSLKGDILIKDLNYSYNGINNAISNFNCKINSGERVLFYGDSGGGKSTIMKLLIGYLDNYNGSIKIGGNDIKVYDLLKIRKSICYVSQKEILFTDSIYENIVLQRTITYSQFLEIAKLMYVDEIANKYSLKYDYLLEENGFNLSGGERQRIILARSLLKNADIYIFDEALSAIEIDKEKQILENIFYYLKGKTIIVVSHRFNNDYIFDRKIKVE